MSNFTGMDVEQVRQLAQRMNQSAQQITEIQQQLTSELQGAPWVGPDREQFLGEWEGTHVPALQNTVTGLEEAAQKAERNASEQESTSSTL